MNFTQRKNYLALAGWERNTAQARIAAEDRGREVGKPLSLRDLSGQVVVCKARVKIGLQGGQRLGDLATEHVVVHCQVVEKCAVSKCRRDGPR